MVKPIFNSHVRRFLEEKFPSFKRLFADEKTGVVLDPPPSFARLRWGDLTNKLHEAPLGSPLRIGSAAPQPVPTPHFRISSGADPRKQKRIKPFDKPIFHQRAYKQFLKNLDQIMRLKLKGNGPPIPLGLGNIYDSVHAYWKDAGCFMPERELLRVALGEEHAAVLDKELPKHSLTGFNSPFKTATALALAHDYANAQDLENNELSLIAGDISNIAGTNNHFEALLKQEWEQGGTSNSQIWSHLGLATEELNQLAQDEARQLKPDEFKQDIQPILEKAAHHLTDWSVRVMMDAAGTVFTRAPNLQVKNYAGQVQLLGAGGDEFYITMPGSKSLAKSVINRATSEVERVVGELGLAQVPHTKQHKKPGLGLSMAAETMQGKSDWDLKRLDPKGEDAVQTNPQASKVLTLEETIQYLSSKHSELKPKEENSSFDPLQDLVLFDAKAPKEASDADLIEHYAKRQLFNVFNPATGVQDTLALPVFLQQRIRADQDLKIVGVSLENLAAVNDNPKFGQDKANEIQASFARQLRAYVRDTLKIEEAEVFSDSGPGRFYIAVPSKVDVAYLQNAICGTSQFWIENINSRKIGDLANAKRPYEKGLSQVTYSASMGRDPSLDLRFELDLHNALLEQKIAAIRRLREDWSQAKSNDDKDLIQDRIIQWATAV